MPKPPAYTFEEFLEHVSAMEHVLNYEFITRNGTTVELEALPPDDEHGRFVQTILKVHDYFSQIYPDRGIAIYKSSRFSLMYEFLCRHLPQFNYGRLAVQGTQQSSVSEALLRAVHEQFAGPDLPKASDAELAKIIARRAEHIADEMEPKLGDANG